MKWFKENWLVVLLVGLIIYVLINSVVRNENYKREIDARSDSIAILKHGYQELEKREALAAEMILAYKFADSVYRDSLNVIKIKLINQKQRHAKQVADLTRIPTDTLYRDLSNWYDSLSIHWGTGSDDGSR